jgi:hypothetical protein
MFGHRAFAPVQPSDCGGLLGHIDHGIDRWRKTAA